MIPGWCKGLPDPRKLVMVLHETPGVRQTDHGYHLEGCWFNEQGGALTNVLGWRTIRPKRLITAARKRGHHWS